MTARRAGRLHPSAPRPAQDRRIPGRCCRAIRVLAQNGPMRSVRDAAGRVVAFLSERFRRGGWTALGWSLRLTAAAVAAYVVARALFPESQPLLAPLTALLVVQLTPVSLLATGVDRVLSVVAGVSVAAAFESAVELNWWSLAIVIAVSLLIGQLLRIGANLIEVPISAMLVMGVGSLAAESAAWQRVSETLVGATVGVASNLLFPPKVGARDASTAIEGLGNDLAELLDRAGDRLSDPDTSGSDLVEAAVGWLDDARRINHGVPAVGTALLRAEESRRLNLRAAGTPDAGPALRHGLEALEHSSVAVRSMFRSLLDAAPGLENSEGGVGPEIKGGVALALTEFAAAIRAFARLVRADAQPGQSHLPEVSTVREALNGLQEARARITDLVLVDDDPVRTELNFALLTTIKRLLTELDLEERLRRQTSARSPTLQRIIRRR